MMSTGSDSSGIVSNALVENETRPQPITMTCRATDATSVLSIFTIRFLFDLCHRRDALESCRRQTSHHAHHCAVIDFVSPRTKTRSSMPPRASVIAFSFGISSSIRISVLFQKYLAAELDGKS